MELFWYLLTRLVFARSRERSPGVWAAGLWPGGAGRGLSPLAHHTRARIPQQGWFIVSCLVSDFFFFAIGFSELMSSEVYPKKVGENIKSIKPKKCKADETVCVEISWLLKTPCFYGILAGQVRRVNSSSGENLSWAKPQMARPGQSSCWEPGNLSLTWALPKRSEGSLFPLLLQQPSLAV